MSDVNTEHINNCTKTRTTDIKQTHKQTLVPSPVSVTYGHRQSSIGLLYTTGIDTDIQANQLTFNSVQFNFIYIAPITIEIISSCFTVP